MVLGEEGILPDDVWSFHQEKPTPRVLLLPSDHLHEPFKRFVVPPETHLGTVP